MIFQLQTLLQQQSFKFKSFSNLESIFQIRILLQFSSTAIIQPQTFFSNTKGQRLAHRCWGQIATCCNPGVFHPAREQRRPLEEEKK